MLPSGATHVSAAMHTRKDWSFLEGNAHTLSGLIGKVVASHAAVALSNPAECTDLYYA